MDIIGWIPFSFDPILILSYLVDTLFHGFRAHCPNLAGLIIVDHSGDFGSPTDMFMRRKSTSIWSTSDHFILKYLLLTL